MKVLIAGSGGHGKVVADAARLAGHVVIGFSDLDAAKIGCIVEPGGASVLLSEAELLDSISSNERLPHDAECVALGVGDNRSRLALATRLGRWCAPPIVHPSAVISPTARVGTGSVVLARAVINPAASVGRAVIVNTGAIIEHDCVVEDGAHLSPGCALAGGVRVGALAWIGTLACVIPGITVGAAAVVGAGAAVVNDVVHGSTVVGVPARRVVRET
jgi:sugar O-acyltransferase (sialic acid O-acetyltransferase NeuD family)